MIEQLHAQQRVLVHKEAALSPFFVSIEGPDGTKLPFLPIGVFRKFHVFCNESAGKTFLSSGSTNDTRAQHSFSQDGLRRYQKLSTAHFRDFLLSLGVALDSPIVSLVPPPSEWPQSSLAAMIDMFKLEGLNVVYNHFEEAVKFASDVVVFGTSFHHLLLAQEQENFIKMTAGKRVTVIDTGGTKGRTRSYDLHEVHAIIQSTYRDAASCVVVSEYGMCELASQAWSLQAPHDGWFRTNDSLTPFIIDLDKRRVIEDGKPGFLAFFDRGNQDSYMAIITEDLATMSRQNPGCFKLVGRAPDASLKGCSLNVKANFQSTASTSETLPSLRGREILACQNRERPEFKDLTALTDCLPDDIWDHSSKKDLSLALQSLALPSELVSATRVDQRILMILSANIPITFLYPTFMCMLRGAKEVHLQLPSIRPHDPFSERVRLQISALVDAIAPFLRPMALHLHSERDIAFSRLKDFDAILVFGSDETIQTFQSTLSASGHTELIGLGSVTNALMLESQDPIVVAETCSRWLGRGCLTPVVLVGNDPCEGFVGKFAVAFEATFTRRMKDAGLETPFSHRHRLLEIESLVKSLGHEPRDLIQTSKNTFVIDLRPIGAQDMSSTDFSFSGAGCGLVFLLTETQLKAFKSLRIYPTDPGFLDAHTQKTWAEWI